MYTMTDEELINYYVDCLIIQYHGKPNASAEMSVWLRVALAEQIVQKVIDAFNLNLNISLLDFDLYPIDDQGTYVEWGTAAITASGDQLDIIGKYVGVSRTINGLDLSKQYFQLVPYDDINPDDFVGLAEYAGADPTAYFMRYKDTINSMSINDEDFRLLILLKIQLNKYDGTLQGADIICQSFFGQAVELIDGQDMTITYTFDQDFITDFIRIVVFMKMLPKPAGVQMTILGGGSHG